MSTSKSSRERTISFIDVKRQFNISDFQIQFLVEHKLLRSMRLNGSFYTSLSSLNKLKKRLKENNGSFYNLALQVQELAEIDRLDAIKSKRIDTIERNQNYLLNVLDVIL